MCVLPQVESDQETDLAKQVSCQACKCMYGVRNTQLGTEEWLKLNCLFKETKLAGETKQQCFLLLMVSVKQLHLTILLETQLKNCSHVTVG